MYVELIGGMRSWFSPSKNGTARLSGYFFKKIKIHTPWDLTWEIYCWWVQVINAPRRSFTCFNWIFGDGKLFLVGLWWTLTRAILKMFGVLLSLPRPVAVYKSFTQLTNLHEGCVQQRVWHGSTRGWGARLGSISRKWPRRAGGVAMATPTQTPCPFWACAPGLQPEALQCFVRSKSKL